MILFGAAFLLDILLIWLLAGTPGHWQIKLAALILASTLNFGVINAFRYGSGWPAGPLNEPALVIDCHVVEPTIYIWAIPEVVRHHQIGFNSPAGAPKAYGLPYSRQLERECNGAKKSQAQGVPVFVGPKSKTHGKHNQKGGYHFYHLPPALLNPKKH